MKFLRNLLDKGHSLFSKDKRFKKFYYLFEAIESFLFTSPSPTPEKGCHIRDVVDIKRIMITVVVAMLPCLAFGIWNIGHQHYLAINEEGLLLHKLGIGIQLMLPIILVSYTAGGIVEVVFALIRKHPVSEGFLVTGMLIPLIVPSTIPLWQVAVATIFAVTIAKEVFGGTGMNILNIAMTARAFLYFAYPKQISGDIWTYLGGQESTTDYSMATALSVAASNSEEEVVTLLGKATSGASEGIFSFFNLFMGTIPGSIGETSTLMCLIGALILIATRVGSWKIMLSIFLGGYLMGLLFNAIGVNSYMRLPAHYHLVMGGFAFGAVFMATDPVSAAHTETGKWIYGFLIGILSIFIRVLNPAYPEGIMLAVLLMNVFAPLIDFYVIKNNKRKRIQHAT